MKRFLRFTYVFFFVWNMPFTLTLTISNFTRHGHVLESLNGDHYFVLHVRDEDKATVVPVKKTWIWKALI